MKQVFDPDCTREAKKVKDEFYVVFDYDREKFLVYDKDPDGAPYVVMVVPDNFDTRTVDNLRKIVFLGPKGVEREIISQEGYREKKLDEESKDIEHDIQEETKWAGRDVVPSTASRDRSSIREAIREEAKNARSN